MEGGGGVAQMGGMTTNDNGRRCRPLATTMMELRRMRPLSTWTTVKEKTSQWDVVILS